MLAIRRRFGALIIVSSLFAGTHAFAAERALIGTPSALPLAASGDPAVVAVLGGLRGRVAASGHVRVIVGVRAAFAPEGALAVASAVQQRADIASVQAAIMDKVPSLKQHPENIRHFDVIPFSAMEVDAAELEALASLTEITSITEDRLAFPTLAQSVPLIGGPTAWSAGYTGAGQTVAVLDTGVDSTHPFLSGKVVSEACYSTTSSTDGASSICPGGGTNLTTVGSALPYAGICPAGECDHGTHVAGIATGNGAGASQPFSGVAKDASVIAVQIFSLFTPAACGGPSSCVASYDSDQIAGLTRVYNLRNSYSIASVNMSLGGGRYYSQSSCDSDVYNAPTKAAIDTLRSVNIATVIASGNSGYTNSMNAPGCISTAVSVGATWDAAGLTISCMSGVSSVDQVTCYSNSASFLNVLAPGSAITSSVPGGGYATWHGTSMATPHVAGAWALLKQKKPSITVTEALSALTSTGVSVTDSRNSIVKPRIQVDAALNSIAGVVAATPPGAPTIGTAGAGDASLTVSYAQPASPGTLTGGAAATITGYTASCTPSGSGTGSGLSILVSSLSNGQAYRCTVTASNSAGLTGPASAASNWVTPTASGGTGLGKKNDFNGDGKSDILWRRPSDGQVTMWEMNGAVTTVSATLYADPDWTVVGTGDFNGDGKTDILWRRTSDGLVMMWLMNGPATLAAVPLYADPAWTVVGTGDFDGDGKADILWRRASDGLVTMWLMNGAAIRSVTALYLDPAWTVAGTGDFDGNGKTDILWRRAADGLVTMWLMNGASVSNWGVVLWDPLWGVTGTGDFNGDGKTDILWTRSTDGLVRMSEMNGLTPMVSADIYADPDWIASGTGDFDGDGKTDILWRRTSDGLATIWFMNGPTISSWSVLSSQAQQPVGM